MGVANQPGVFKSVSRGASRRVSTGVAYAGAGGASSGPDERIAFLLDPLTFSDEINAIDYTSAYSRGHVQHVFGDDGAMYNAPVNTYYPFGAVSPDSSPTAPASETDRRFGVPWYDQVAKQIDAVATNRVLHARDFSAWGTVTATAASAAGVDGSTATVSLEDNSAVATKSAKISYSVSSGGYIVAAFCFKKDASATHVARVDIVGASGSNYINIWCDPSDGTISYSGAGNEATAYVEDPGGDWVYVHSIVWVNVGQSGAYVELFPAYSSTKGGAADASVTGTTVFDMVHSTIYNALRAEWPYGLITSGTTASTTSEYNYYGSLPAGVFSASAGAICFQFKVKRRGLAAVPYGTFNHILYMDGGDTFEVQWTPNTGSFVLKFGAATISSTTFTDIGKDERIVFVLRWASDEMQIGLYNRDSGGSWVWSTAGSVAGKNIAGTNRIRGLLNAGLGLNVHLNRLAIFNDDVTAAEFEAEFA